jgi:hypothetical protein
MSRHLGSLTLQKFDREEHQRTNALARRYGSQCIFRRMGQQGIPDAITALTAATRAQGCGTIPELMHQFQVSYGAALLARLGCAGNPVALWEHLTYDIARRLLPADDLTPLIAE